MDLLSITDYPQFKNKLQKSNCQKCTLSSKRNHIVVDRGNFDSKILFIGEAPGAKEDDSGLCFVGRAGKMLDLMFSEINIDTNQDTLIANIAKCRPPKNRVPNKIEAAACFPFLLHQILLVKPQVIILLGASALKYLDKSKTSFEMINEVGRFFRLKEFDEIDFFPIFHPAYLLYNPGKKNLFKEHLQILNQYLIKQKIHPKINKVSK